MRFGRISACRSELKRCVGVRVCGGRGGCGEVAGMQP